MLQFTKQKIIDILILIYITTLKKIKIVKINNLWEIKLYFHSYNLK